MFRQGFTCPALLEDAQATVPVRGYHPLWPDFPDGSGFGLRVAGLVRFRSPLLAESRLMSFPPATEMVQLAGFASRRYGFTARYRTKRWVSPFGDPRIKARSQLPGAYRKVLRPSSPLSAKASTKCPSTLESKRSRTDPKLCAMSVPKMRDPFVARPGKRSHEHAASFGIDTTYSRCQTAGPERSGHRILFVGDPRGDGPEPSSAPAGLVEVTGIEPATSCLQSRRSPS